METFAQGPAFGDGYYIALLCSYAFRIVCHNSAVPSFEPFVLRQIMLVVLLDNSSLLGSCRNYFSLDDIASERAGPVERAVIILAFLFRLFYFYSYVSCFQRMRHKPKVVVRAIHMHQDGMSFFKVQNHLWQHDGVRVSRQTLTKWEKKYSDFLKSDKPRGKADHKGPHTRR